LKRPITEKNQAIDMFGHGFFGNNIRQWNNVEALAATLADEKDEFDGLVMMRFRFPDGPVQKDLTVEEGLVAAAEVAASGVCSIDDIYFNEVLENQDSVTAVQGELQRLTVPPFGLYFMCNFTPMRMREAMRHKDVQHVFGIRVKAILAQYCDLASYENIFSLLEDYPGHIIELTVCTEPVGLLACFGHNTIVWEVRDY
jgi:hypothetical protein